MTRTSKIDISSLTEDDRNKRCGEIAMNMVDADSGLIMSLSNEALTVLPWLVEYISPVANVITQKTEIATDTIFTVLGKEDYSLIDELADFGWLYYVEDDLVDFTPVALSWIVQNAIRSADA